MHRCAPLPFPWTRRCDTYGAEDLHASPPRREGGQPVAHDSGFRRGAHDVTHRDPKPLRTTRGSRRIDDVLTKRFHEHEKAQEEKPAEEAPQG